MENNNLELLFDYVPSERTKKQRDHARRHARRKTAMFAYVVEGQEQDIENYDEASKADFKGFVLHHRLEEQGYTMKQLKEEGLYYNRPASELIFLTHKQHGGIHKTIRERMSRICDRT